MSLRRVYKFWIASLIISTFVSGLYVGIATKMYLSNLRPGEDSDFAALPYLVYAHIFGVVCTGLLTAFLINLRGDHTVINKRLAAWLILTHVTGGALAVILMNYAKIFFFNPLAFAIFAFMPHISWSIANRRANSKVIATVIVLILLWVATPAYFWFSIFRN